MVVSSELLLEAAWLKHTRIDLKSDCPLTCCFSPNRLSLDNIIEADISAAAVLISMGAMLGRITPIQLLLMGIIEIVVFAANEHLQLKLMSVRNTVSRFIVHYETHLILT